MLLGVLSLRVGRLTPAGLTVVPIAIPLEAPAVAGAEVDQAATAVAVDLTEVALEDPSAVPPAPEPPPADLPVGDQERIVERESSPQRGNTTAPGTAAADTGMMPGKAVPAAFRRDSSTLHARLGDGAELYQPSREQTARRASSPQPIRQERVVGMRDSARDQRPRPAAEVTPPPTSPPEAGGALDPEVVLAPDQLPPRDPGRDLARGDGPLDTEQGPRRFDVENEGIARDTHAARAASDETQPGRLDLSSPSASGPNDGAPGRGPSEAPGAVSRPSTGVAPAVYGANAVVERGQELALSTAEREYLRYLAEIRRRVASVLRFPKRLALMLEQGETVVHFVVRADGKLAGDVQIVKSAGFDEFDAEAVRAVTRAAPFPRTGRTLNVSMPIAFDNPVVR